MENMTEKFAEFCEELKYEDLPPEVIKRTKLLILDTVGIIIRARHDAESTSSLVSAIDKLEMGNGTCQVFSDKKTYTPSAAALLNGTLAHSLDFDDTHAEASLHSSAPILSAALAAAQMNKSSGQELITACVVGYETQIRLGLAGGSSAHYKKGFHPTATCGVFGAVAAAGHLMGLTKDQFISAFGIALSQSAGSMQFLTDGAWTKRSHVGQAAQNGLSCAIMAGEGFKGPSQAFEGQWGYFHSYASGGDFKKALDGLGKKFETLNLGVKPYPSCRYSHAAIDGIIELKNELGFSSEDVGNIDIGLSNVLAFDISWSRLFKGGKFHQKNNKTNISIEAFVADIKEIPLHGKCIDVVTSNHALEPNGRNLPILLKELFRITKRKLVLFEPSYELNSKEGKERMDRLGYIKNIEAEVEKLGGKVTDIIPICNTSNPLNPTACYVIEPASVKSVSLESPKYCVPGTDLKMENNGSFLLSKDTGLVFPVLDGIPILRTNSAILATSKF